MKKILLALIVFTLGIAPGVFAAEIGVAFGAVGKDTEVLAKYLDIFSKRTGHSAKVIPMPASTTDQFGQYRLWLSAKNDSIDLYMLDVIWAPQLSEHFVDLSVAAKDEAKKHFPSVIASQTVNGKLVAMPFFTDAPMLFYRKDLLMKYKQEPPKTWAQLAASAKIIQDGERKAGNSKMQGFVFQGKAYEGLTCDALEWVASFGGGEIVDAKGNITINNPNAVNALKTVASWVGTISPVGVTSYQEEEARGVWQTGNAVFMRNWPYAYNLGNSNDSPIKGKFDVVPLPKGEGANARSAATLGGWNVGVSNYSKNKEAAIQLALFLSSEEVQKMLAVDASHYPTIPSLYKDKDVLAVAPFFTVAYDVLSNSVARPSATTKRKYNEVSSNFWTAAQKVLTGSDSAENALAELERKLKILKGNSW